MATIRITREGGRSVDEVAWQAEQLEVVEKPNGPAAAALLSAGVGSLALGVLTVWNEASTGMADFLRLDTGVGPLSGKTVFAVVLYVIAWAILAPVMWRRSLSWAPVLTLSALLIAGGYVGTFPKFFQLFAE
ncbi:MAG TPA: hypothetical protein VJB57_18700 [Dehalococcoidia bacterium]|nr:hypothetical protein [Dehalococcoidia bacterium]